MKKAMSAVLVLAAILLPVTAALAQDGPLVFNVRASQRAGTNLVDVYYGVTNDELIPVTITMHLSTDGGATYPHLCGSVTGDVGGSVDPGVNRHIVWDAGADFPGYSSDTCKLRITADGGTQGGDFKFISGGTFNITHGDNGPWVHVGNFYIGVTEVTQAQYAALVPGYQVGFPNRPVGGISWYEAVEFCNLLSERDGLEPVYDLSDWSWDDSANGYRLPTEAEWQWACQAGSITNYCNGNSEADLALVGWYSGNSGNHAHDVHTKAPNAWGLYDMHGNMLEWCWDRYCSYPEGTLEDPYEDNGAAGCSGSIRVPRGGRYSSNAISCQSASRAGYHRSDDYYYLGFRLARSAD